MPLEIKELIIQALIGDKNSDEDEPEENDDCECEDKKTQAQRDTIDLVSKMIKNEKER